MIITVHTTHHPETLLRWKGASDQPLMLPKQQWTTTKGMTTTTTTTTSTTTTKQPQNSWAVTTS